MTEVETISVVESEFDDYDEGHWEDQFFVNGIVWGDEKYDYFSVSRTAWAEDTLTKFETEKFFSATLEMTPYHFNHQRHQSHIIVRFYKNSGKSTPKIGETYTVYQLFGDLECKMYRGEVTTFFSNFQKNGGVDSEVKKWDSPINDKFSFIDSEQEIFETDDVVGGSPLIDVKIKNKKGGISLHGESAMKEVVRLYEFLTPIVESYENSGKKP